MQDWEVAVSLKLTVEVHSKELTVGSLQFTDCLLN